MALRGWSWQFNDSSRPRIWIDEAPSTSSTSYPVAACYIAQPGLLAVTHLAYSPMAQARREKF